MATSRPTTPSRSLARPARDDYWALSSRPWHTFLFLLGFVLLFEAGSLIYLTDERSGIQHTIRAKRLLEIFFLNFGVAGFMVTGLAMLTVLLIWHVLSKDRWTVRPVVLAGMTLEAALWALPLLVFGQIFQRAATALSPGPALDGAALGAVFALPRLAEGPASLLQMPWQARATIAIGAGIYEELLFRLVGIAVLHFIVRDLLQSKEFIARVIAVVGTAAAFAAYHDVSMLGPADKWAALGFYFSAGAYFGVIYVGRGFGIVVAAHAVYDILALVVFVAAR